MQRPEDRHFCQRGLVMVLSHHPLAEGWLNDEKDAKNAVRANAKIHLSGHVHEPEDEAVWTGWGNGHVRIVAGAVHGEKDETVAYGYSAGAVLRKADGNWVVRVWPRRYSPVRQGYITDSERTPPGKEYAEHGLQLGWVPKG